MVKGRPFLIARDQGGCIPSDRQAARTRRKGQNIHRGRANETRNENTGWAIIKAARIGTLFNPPPVQDHDAIRHCDGFHLIMGDINHRDTQLTLKRFQLDPHFMAKFGVQIGQRFVHQADWFFCNDRTPQGHTLLLATRYLTGAAVQ